MGKNRRKGNRIGFRKGNHVSPNTVALDEYLSRREQDRRLTNQQEEEMRLMGYETDRNSKRRYKPYRNNP